MINNLPKRIAYKTLFQNRLFTSPDFDELKHIIELNCFTFIEYKKHSNSEYVSELIKKLEIEREIEHNDSFLYVKNSLRFVFLNADVSIEDKCSLLCHELGHILDPHFESHQLNYSKIKKEEFANEFSCYIKNPSIWFRLFMLIIKKWKLLVTIIALLIYISGLLFVLSSRIIPQTSRVATDGPNSEILDNAYYVTSGGKKYHKKSCVVVKYRNNLTKYTLGAAQDAGYEPCLICLSE